jgi:hypothetical protein
MTPLLIKGIIKKSFDWFFFFPLTFQIKGRKY